MSKIVDFIKNNICNTKVGDAIINEVRIRELDGLVYIPKNLIDYARDKKHPTEDMQKSKEYFKNNRQKIKENLSLLYDEESRICYKKAIKYRFTHNMKERPINSGNRYFVKGIIKLSDNDIIVDAGAFVGDTVREIKKITNNKYKKIICFEPDTYNYKMLCRITDSRVEKINAGLWNKKDTLRFFDNGSVGSKVINENDDYKKVIEIPVVALDEIEQCKEATYIKMDIEGSEQKAIEGAKNIIKNNKPQMAICLYHTDEDMIKIIPQIHELVPEYKLYVRQHSYLAAETVLYAVL